MRKCALIFFIQIPLRYVNRGSRFEFLAVVKNAKDSPGLSGVSFERTEDNFCPLRGVECEHIFFMAISCHDILYFPV